MKTAQQPSIQRGLKESLLKSLGTDLSLEEIGSEKINGDQFRMIPRFASRRLQEHIGDALFVASESKKEVNLDNPKDLGLKEKDVEDLRALAFLYTCANPEGLIVTITPKNISVRKTLKVVA